MAVQVVSRVGRIYVSLSFIAQVKAPVHVIRHNDVRVSGGDKL